MSGPTLTEFLLARIAEDEAVVRKIADALAADPGAYASIVHDHPELAAGDCAGYLADYDPARVLAECAAKRRIVEDYRGVALRPALSSHATVQGFTAALEGVLADLATVYPDHPDYRQEWRP